MTRLLVALFVLVASSVQAQPIHGHPQKAAYASPAEYRKPSFQCHWNEPLPEANPDGSNAKAIIDASLLLSSHLHFDPVGPIYSDINDLLRMDFTVKLFQSGGEAVFDLDRQETVTKIEWDDIGEQFRRVIVGDPASHALIQRTGHFTIDPRRTVGGAPPGGHGFPPRGWYSPQIEIDWKPNDHIEIAQVTRLPFYSTLDPSAPDGSLTGFPQMISSCYPHSPKISEWGTNYVEADSFLPLTPIFVPWPIDMGTAAYGGKEIGLGFFEHRIDFDFHGGVPGKVLQHLDEQNFTNANRAPVLDPAIIGSGLHSNAFLWSKPTKDRSENITALLVWPIEVGAGVPPPPPLCQDPNASNLGKPLPCVVDTVCVAPAVLTAGQCVVPIDPLPPLVWQSFVLGAWDVRFEREVNEATGTATGRFRACIGTQCLVVKP